LSGSSFEDVDLAQAVFDDVDLHGARFSNARLAGAQFSNVSLRDANITDADLKGLRIQGVAVTDLLAAWAARQAQPRPAAVVYAKHLAGLQRFYAAVGGLAVTQAEADHVVLESPAFELVLVAMPAAIADRTVLAQPPERREDTPIKLVFPCDDIARIRALAASLGGALNPPGREWSWRGQLTCDGHDPEGNVLQFRQAAR
jgi:uncharacterized protein YjbI with pentapeptide repeats